MSLSATRLLLYVRDVDALTAFYHAHFALPILETIPGEWAVLSAGGIELALHRVGPAYRNASAAGSSSNAKLVFTLAANLVEKRAQLLAAGVPMREIKRFDGFAYTLCDGADPEGNMFQLSQPDASPDAHA